MNFSRAGWFVLKFVILCDIPAVWQDVILPKVLDDQTFVTINSIMLFNNVAVSSFLSLLEDGL
jgi:hypothetical protein